MIPENVLSQYEMGTLESYELKHGISDDTTKTFYETFLDQTDRVVLTALETGNEIDEEVKRCREIAREELDELIFKMA